MRMRWRSGCLMLRFDASSKGVVPQIKVWCLMLRFDASSKGVVPQVKLWYFKLSVRGARWRSG